MAWPPLRTKLRPSRTTYPGFDIRHEIDFKGRINRLWAEPADQLIAAIGADVFARFARAFNIAERLEGVHYALFALLKNHQAFLERRSWSLVAAYVDSTCSAYLASL